MKVICSALVLAGLLVGWAHGDFFTGFSLDFVSIGDAGNSTNSAGRGAVGYNYRIAETEVSIEQFNATGVGSATGAAGTPAVNVSWNEAALFCNWLSQDAGGSGAYLVNGTTVTGMMTRAEMQADGGLFYVLPTVDEWHKAAFYNGSSYSVYANGTGTAPVAGTAANYDQVNSATWDVGSGALEQNGTYNMSGNAWEWTDSGDGIVGADQIVLGGSWFSPDAQPLKGDYDTLENPSVGLETDQIGFRVAAIPEPATISLMGLSTFGLFLTRNIRRRRRFGISLMPVRRGPACDAFITEKEFARREEMAQSGGIFDPIFETVQEQLVESWNKTRAACKRADVAFWNYMVNRDEKRAQRRAAFREKVRKRFVDGLDAFLARIMK